MNKNEIVPVNAGLLSILSTGKASDVLPFTQEIYLLDVVLAKVEYTPMLEAMLPQLTEGTELTMKRDLDNELDLMTVSVCWSEVPLGYLPIEQNLIIARLLDAGKLFACKVKKAEMHHDFVSGKPWIRIAVAIAMID